MVNSDGYSRHMFYGSGTFVVNKATYADVLIVGGGNGAISGSMSYDKTATDGGSSSALGYSLWRRSWNGLSNWQ